MATAKTKEINYLRRSRILAASYSFFFAGFGQIYNGDLSRGILIFLARSFSLLLLPFLFYFNFNVAPIKIFVTFILLHFFLWFYSILDAFIRTSLSKVHSKWYNRKVCSFILLVFIACTQFSVLILVLNSLFFYKVSNNQMEPNFTKNEIIIGSKFFNHSLKQGELYFIEKDKQLTVKRLLAEPEKMRIVKLNTNYNKNFDVVEMNETLKTHKICLHSSQKSFMIKATKKKINFLLIEYLSKYLTEDKFLVINDNLEDFPQPEIIAKKNFIGGVYGSIF